MRTPTVTDVEADPEFGVGPADRRRIGMIVVILSLVAALCVPGIVGRRTVGAAVAGPPADPPVAGQCRAPVATEIQRELITGMPLVDCEVPHSAEVVWIGGFAPQDPYPDLTTTAAMHRARAACGRPVQQYLGLTTEWRPGTAVPPAPPQAEIQVVVPTRHQWSHDQRWFACQVRPAVSPLPVEYVGTIRDAAVTGLIPEVYAWCADVIGGAPTPCTEPHNAQKLSAAIPAGNHLDCMAVAESLTQHGDPTWNGQLSITGWQEAGRRTACWATARTADKFVGSLIGRGDRPLIGG